VRLILLLCLCACGAASAQGLDQALGWTVGPSSARGAALLLSDLHFDPFTDPGLAPALAAAPVQDWDAILSRGQDRAFPGYSDDCNWLLWRSTLAQLSSPGLAYDYGLLMGDYLAHHFDKKFRHALGKDPQAYAAFVAKTLAYLDWSLRKALPKVPLYWALGNNDSDCGDYGLQPGGAFLKTQSQAWATVAADPAAAADFAKGGYCDLALPGTAGRVIVLNTVIWAREYNNPCGQAGADPGKDELSWLDRRLDEDQAAGAPVTLIMHIPPGTNAFGAALGLPVQTFYRPEIQGPFLDLARRHAGLIRLAYAGHTHFDDFKVYRPQGVPVLAVHLAPSVGPNHGNNPSFQVLCYDRATAAPRDLATYTLLNLTSTAAAGPAPDWPLEYGFSRAYGHPFSLAGLAAAALDIRAGGPARANYESFYAGRAQSHGALGKEFWKPYSCAQTSFDPDAFDACLHSQPH
jgi:sphingomyelin phosphodiesterase acid-like 3